MTEAFGPTSDPEDHGTAGWYLSPDRTRIAVRASGTDRRLHWQQLDATGHSVGPALPCPLPDPAAWEVLGWPAEQTLALWQRRPSGSHMQLVDVVAADLVPLRHALVGRPVDCRVDPSGQLVVLVAVSRNGRPQLWAHTPNTGAYLPLVTESPFSAVGAWSADGTTLVVNLDAEDDSPGVMLLSDDGRGHVPVDVAWPAGIRPVSAVGYGSGRVGLTGLDASGRCVPVLLDVVAGTVRLLDSQAGTSCVDVSPSGRRVLVAAWDGECFRYRVVDDTGRLVGEFGPSDAIVTDPRFCADKNHILALYQSPMSPPALRCWGMDGGAGRPVTQGPTRTHDGIRWALRWIDNADGRVPEWTFAPRGSDPSGTVLYLHGGPGGRLNQAYDPLIAALVDAGWSVVGMNYPGSSGYGTEYLERARGDWGGPDAAAIERRVRALRAEVPDCPLTLYGHSYGGYLALLVATQAADLIDGVAVWAPVTDIQLLLDASTGSQRRWLEQQVGVLRLDPDRLRRRSPVDRLPELRDIWLLVGHGRLDERCPVEQSRRLVDGLRRYPDAAARLSYLEDVDSGHTPLSWHRWVDAVVSHFTTSRSRSPLASGRSR
jgi:pimeloyl-ACP methyl ester carboxylesterase